MWQVQIGHNNIIYNHQNNNKKETLENLYSITGETAK